MTDQLFRAFLPVAAQMNTEILNYNKIAFDVGISPVTVQRYFNLLVDTHLGFFLEPYHHSIRKRQRQNPKFYFFDCGVPRSLQKRLNLNIQEGTYEFSKAFEQFLILEMMRLNDYQRKDYSFYYLRTKDDAEIDLIIERPGMPTALIEIKSRASISERETRTLNRFIKDFKNPDVYLLSLDPVERKYENVWALPWRKGIEALGLG